MRPIHGHPAVCGADDHRIRVAHVITRLILGGAQENTLHSVLGHRERGRFSADLVTGPTRGREGSLIATARERGVVPRVVSSLVREINPVLDPVALVHLALLLRRGRYTIVHTHSSKAGVLGRAAAHMARVPIVVHTVHGWGFNDRQRPAVRRLYVRLERGCARLSDALIVVSPRLADSAAFYGVGRPEQFVTIRSGIDLQRYSCPARDPARTLRELGIPEASLVIGSVMRLSPQKAPQILIRAVPAILAEEPAARIVIVGDGPQRAAVETEIARLGVGDRVHLTGLRTDVPDLLAAFDVFVLPSYWEGLPRVIPQAMAAGVPVVASNVDGNAEVVEHGVSGLLVEPGDVPGFASAILNILRDPDLARRMREAGRQRARAFDVDEMVDAIEALYDRLLRARGLADPLDSTRAHMAARPRRPATNG